jgi:hypothetical protein
MPNAYRTYSGVEESPEMRKTDKSEGVDPTPVVDSRLNSLLTKQLLKKRTQKRRMV